MKNVNVKKNSAHFKKQIMNSQSFQNFFVKHYQKIILIYLMAILILLNIKWIIFSILHISR